MYSFIRNLLFRMDPEQAHEWAIRGLRTAQHLPGLLWVLERKMAVRDPRLTVQCNQLQFPNPVGLAAGFDKNADVYPALAALGFGSVEVGTLTPKPQPGNPRPRLYRLPEDEAVINRMGFNNRGIIRASTSLATLPRPVIPIGINLGKNRKTPGEEAAGDYRTGLRALYRHGDYFVINISSPNTQGLRDLQQADSLAKLLSILIEEREELRDETGEIRPLFVKLAPDLSRDALSEAVRIGLEQGIDGLIAVNTTLAREELKSPHRTEAGGLSGRPLHHRSIQWIRQIHRVSEGKVPIIGVGGIFDGKDAYRTIRAGASLVQVYTGMIYRGPSIARAINLELLQLLEQDGLSSITDAVGLDA
ncbi:quinone-dependent dihydroorotate dehydrogenase [Kroppenstedtia eburnea]|uniref:Dihydroorotate dehydrogenase (quinone) n=1 Tax=Kroppenstedtia eburnea TaxID=714067 RepID=A0A1N7JWJ9_9BACL|nr:quinone-dependent dihydroorotate dehydrogenase [Kroppenstedtia eburnea]QKI83410.1 quinone-dependent dihydroorotate dehydrogenase [Kroppenstedtia eburnea]SIS53574.1 dihydroorotate oxidase A [Kroppenstedtia eburnea]